MTTHRRSLVLASGSPRRRELLSHLGVVFEVVAADADETRRAHESSHAYVTRVAETKAVAVADRRPHAVVLAADTTVTIDGDVLGKPADEVDAARMLGRLSGRRHDVLTAVTIVSDGQVRTSVEKTTVTFSPMTADEVEWYVGTGEPLDKAGAYAIQGAGGLFVTSISGSASNVVGLPLHVVARLFGEVGLSLLSFAG